jgi:hypothetical protein
MSRFTESNITLDFPDSNFFRFANCEGYTALSGNYFKEMDDCWYNANHNLYWFIELKDFSLATLTTFETIDQKTWEMVKKAIDSLCMFLASKHNYAYAANLNPCFPSIPNNSTCLKLITIVHCNESQKSDIQLLNERFKSKFKPYANLFGIAHYSVLEHSAAIRILPEFVK